MIKRLEEKIEALKKKIHDLIEKLPEDLRGMFDSNK